MTKTTEKTEMTTRNGNQMATKNREEMNTRSTRFLAKVEAQFLAEMGQGPQFTPLEKRLTQHMYLRVNEALKDAEARRKSGTEYTWTTLNLQKLALDTVHAVSLGLDALVKNHVHPVFYFNGRAGKYDVDLQLGYMGRDYVARRHAYEPPLEIVYELVYDSDHFKALPRSASREVEGYEFEITSPFDRGQIIGGFGYIVHDDSRKNRLVLVTQRDFKRSQEASKGGFWSKNEVEMHHKTVMHRVASKIPMDPEKVNAAAFAALVKDDERATPEERADLEAQRHANRTVMEIPESLDDAIEDDSRTIDVDDAQGEPAAPQQGALASGPGF